MNLEVKDLIAKIKPLLLQAKKYIGFAVVILILLAFGFIINQIRSYATIEPSDEAFTERLQGLTTAGIDEDAVKTVENLQSTNVDVQTLFKEARDNPFQE